MFLTILSWVCPLIGVALILFDLNFLIDLYKRDMKEYPLHEREEPKQ